MKTAVTDKVDTLHRHFRTLRTAEPKPDSSFDQNELDRFLVTISHFYAACLECGFARADSTTIELEDVHVKEYFITGFTCIQNGMEPLAIQAIMEYMALTMNNTREVSYQELFEIKIVEKIMPFIQHCKVNEYLCFIGQFCSPQLAGRIQEEFKKYIL